MGTSRSPKPDFGEFLTDEYLAISDGDVMGKGTLRCLATSLRDAAIPTYSARRSRSVSSIVKILPSRITRWPFTVSPRPIAPLLEYSPQPDGFAMSPWAANPASRHKNTCRAISLDKRNMRQPSFSAGHRHPPNKPSRQSPLATVGGVHQSWPTPMRLSPCLPRTTLFQRRPGGLLLRGNLQG